MDRARAAFAAFVGADTDGMAAVPNATTGVNTVLNTLRFSAGDELLTTDHCYNACRNALEAIAERDGARIVVVPIPFPIDGPERIVESVLGAVNDRTRLALLDHITSPTAIILPMEELVQGLESRGVPVLVDGAHAPGMLPLDLKTLGASWYTGNGHKWICAPKGAAFLWASEACRDRLRPLVISHGANCPRPGRSRFHDEFDWVGTIDPSPFFCVGDAIEFMGSLLPGGWPELREHNHKLVLEGREMLLEVLGIDAPAPASMIGSIASVPLPDDAPEDLFDRLWDRHGAVAPVMKPPVSPLPILRISAQLYNQRKDYERLAEGLRKELG